MILDPVIRNIHRTVEDVLRALSGGLTAADNFAPEGTVGQVLTSNGDAAPPSYQDPAAGGDAVAWGSITNKPVSFPPEFHAASHGVSGSDVVTLDAAQIASGVLARAQLPTQVAYEDETNSFLGDQTISGDLLLAGTARRIMFTGPSPLAATIYHTGLAVLTFAQAQVRVLTALRSDGLFTASSNINLTGVLNIGGLQVVGPRQAFIADPTGGVTQDAEARAAVVSILDLLIAHGLMASA